MLKGDGMGRNTGEEWKRIEKAVEGTVGQRTTVWNEDWFGEDCTAAVAEKHRAR
jgi:hypothetical protein